MADERTPRTDTISDLEALRRGIESSDAITAGIMKGVMERREVIPPLPSQILEIVLHYTGLLVTLLLVFTTLQLLSPHLLSSSIVPAGVPGMPGPMLPDHANRLVLASSLLANQGIMAAFVLKAATWLSLVLTAGGFLLSLTTLRLPEAQSSLEQESTI